MGQAWQGQPIQQIGMTQGYDFGNDPNFQQAQNTLQNSPYMGQFDPQQYQQYFQQGVADPAIKQYEQQILPAIQSRHYNPSSVNSSSLDQALRTSGEELSTGLSGLRANFLQQGQQSHANNQYNAIAQALGLSQAKANQTQPILQEAQSGWLQDIFKLIAQNGSQFAQSAYQQATKPGVK